MVAFGAGERRYFPDLFPRTDDPYPGGPQGSARPRHPVQVRGAVAASRDSIIPAATAAFNDSARPAPGIVIRSVASSSSAGPIPLDSLPITIHPRPEGEVSYKDFPPN